MKNIKITCDVDTRLAPTDLTPLQGELKVLSKENLEKLKKSIKKFGFAFPVFVWENPEDAKIYIIDGHQRLNALNDLKKEGYKIPQIPVSFIQASDLAEAKSKLLAAASHYGKFSKNGMKDFLDFDFSSEDLVSTFEIPDFSMADFVGENILEPDTDDDGAINPDEKITVSAHERSKDKDKKEPTDQVKMVQLFLAGDEHERFLQQAAFMIENDGCKNLTDAVVKAMNEKFSSYKKA